MSEFDPLAVSEERQLSGGFIPPGDVHDRRDILRDSIAHP
jgi:hypothetical protein